MGEDAVKALNNARASSAMEGLPLERRHIDTIEKIANGQLSLHEYFDSLKKQYQGG